MSFMMTAETGVGIAGTRSVGRHRPPRDVAVHPSMGSAAVNGRRPVSISSSVTPRAYRAARESIDRFIRPVCSGAM